VAPVPLYLQKTSECLLNQPADKSILIKAIDTAVKEISPIGDVRGSVEYKRSLLRSILMISLGKIFQLEEFFEAAE